MGSHSRRNFILVAVGAALVIVAGANLVADRFDEPVEWIPSLITALIVGAFVAFLVFRPRTPAEETRFVITAKEEKGPPRLLETRRDKRDD